MGNPNLLSAHQHRFVLAILEGKTQVEAYKAARFPSPDKMSRRAKELSDDAASRRAAAVLKLPSVTEALTRARQAELDRASHTLGSLVGRLDHAYDVALSCEPPQVSGAVAATLGIAKLLGLVIDRKQLDVTMHKPALSSTALELSVDEWKRQFAGPHSGPKGSNEVGSNPTISKG